MTYASEQDMDRYFGAADVSIAADRDGDADNDTSVVKTALAHASQVIDSYVGVRYDLPLSLVQRPRILVNICCDIAMYRMSVTSHSLTDDKETRYKDAVAWLTKLSAGKVTLGEAETTEEANDNVETGSASTTDGQTTVGTAQPRQFTRTTLKGLF